MNRTILGLAVPLLAMGVSGPAAEGPGAVGAWRAVTGEYEVSFTPGESWVSIARRQGPAPGGSLRWLPGGGSADLPLLNLAQLRSSADGEGTADGPALALAGRLEGLDYTVGISLPDEAPGLIHLWVDLTPTQAVPADSAWFRDPQPEFVYADPQGQPADPKAVFYFETPTPHPVKIWHWRRDLNQFVYFGDPALLSSSVLCYTDFTALNDYFAESGTGIFRSVTGWEVHEDIVEQPPGAFGAPAAMPFRFGLRVPAPRQPLRAGRTYRISDAFLHLVPGAPGLESPVEPARRFLAGYAHLLRHVRRPTPAFRPWLDTTERLVAELSRRRDPDWMPWTLASPHFNLLPYLDYFDRFSPARSAKLNEMALRQLEPGFGPDYVNDFGSKGIYGWYRSREDAAKADFWQGYLWPIYILNEYALRSHNADLQRRSLGLTDVLLDTGRRLDYTFAVFVDLNAARNVETGYDYDYGVAGLYAALMLQYHQMTNEGKYLDEATKAAQRLTRFGFASGFEMQIPALSMATLLELHQITGDPTYLDGVYVQLAVILKHTWLFSPRYGRFADRDLFALTSCRANLCYANAAEEGMLMRLLRQCLAAGEGHLDPECRALVAEILRSKAHSWVDALPATHADTSLIHLEKPENWDTIQPDSVVPMEPFGYNLDGKKLGFLNECIYGLGMLAEACLMQFHPLGEGSMLYTEGPVDLEKQPDGAWRLRLLGQREPLRAGLRGVGISLETDNGQPLSAEGTDPQAGWAWFQLQPGPAYRVRAP